jgi:hypothetical protein
MILLNTVPHVARMQSGIAGRRGLDCAAPVLSEVEAYPEHSRKGLHPGYSC